MTNRRVDAIYFVLLLAVSMVGYHLANRPSREGGTLEMPVLEPPELVLEDSFAFPYSVVKFKKRTPPTLALSDNLESVLVEIRSALLENSASVDVRPIEQLAAITE
jgi:hypothetical protein